MVVRELMLTAERGFFGASGGNRVRRAARGTGVYDRMTACRY